MATIWDADILIWAASTLNSLKKKGVNDLPRTLNVQPYDLLKAICRDTGGRQYQLLREGLGRLQATTVVTNIRVKRGKKHRQFSWIESWTDLVDEETGQSRGMSITLSDWLYEGILMEGGLLAIDPVYFSITGGRERWLYRVARKHAGGAGEGGFTIALPTLFEKSGAEGTYRRFKFEIQAIVRANQVPQFDLSLERSGAGEFQLRMARRAEDHAPAAPKPKPKVKAPETLGGRAAMLPLFGNQLEERTIERVRVDFPGWDVYALKADFDAWLAKDSERAPEDYQAAFYGYVRRVHGRNRA
jgi:plasmid replication initiation protein